MAVVALLVPAGMQTEARSLKGHTGDYTVLLPLGTALTGGTLLVRHLNGQMLTPAHRTPLRLVAPGRVCWYSMRWVDRLEVLAAEATTTDEGLAWL